MADKITKRVSVEEGLLFASLPYFAGAFFFFLAWASFQVPWYVPGGFLTFFLALVAILERWPGFGGFLENPVGFIKGERDDFKPGLVAMAYTMACVALSGLVFFVRVIGELFI